MSKSSLEGAQKAVRSTEDMLKSLKGEDLRQALLPAGRIFLAGAKRRAPYDPKREKGTHLRDAIFIDARKHLGHQGDILVGVNHKRAPHAHLMEFGWVKKPEGHPFLRPTATEDKPQIMQAVADGVEAVVKKHTK